MSYLYLASQCPQPTYPSACPTISTASASATNAPTLTPIVAGNTTWATLTNQNYSAIAGGMGFGGNGFGVTDGLTLSTGASLSLAVAAGHAMSMGPVEWAGGTVVVPDNTSKVFIWLFQNQVLSYTTTTTAPDANAVYIGNCTTLSGAVTVVDYTNVVYLLNGSPFRFTNDAGAPSDSPNYAVRVFTKTLAGTYYWDGAYHQQFSAIIDSNKYILVSGDAAYIAAGFQTTMFGTVTVPSGASLTCLGLLRLTA